MTMHTVAQAIALAHIAHGRAMFERWFQLFEPARAGHNDEVVLDGYRVGSEIRRARHVSRRDIDAFARISGDRNRIHFDEAYARTTVFKKPIAHGILTASYISAAIAEMIPGVIYLSQTLNFSAPVYPGDTVETHILITHLDPTRRRIRASCTCSTAGNVVLSGEAQLALAKRI